jgi:hypothetical protein
MHVCMHAMTLAHAPNPQAFLNTSNLAEFLGIVPVEAIHMPVPMNFVFVGFAGDGNMGVNYTSAELQVWFGLLDHVLPHNRIELAELSCAEDGESRRGRPGVPGHCEIAGRGSDQSPSSKLFLSRQRAPRNPSAIRARILPYESSPAPHSQIGQGAPSALTHRSKVQPYEPSPAPAWFTAASRRSRCAAPCTLL